MKMNKKGFTLIELLAVIVILAIIALIAVPQVIRILNNARLSAAKDSAYGILKAADTYAAEYMIKNDGNSLASNTTFSCDGKSCGSLEFKGTKPTKGSIGYNGNGEAVINIELEINGFFCTMNGDQVECTTTSKCA